MICCIGIYILIVVHVFLSITVLFANFIPQQMDVLGENLEQVHLFGTFFCTLQVCIVQVGTLSAEGGENIFAVTTH